MDLSGKKVLVTGAGGFIGSHLVERLLEEKADVTAFVMYNPRNNFGFIEQFPEESKKHIRIVSGDLRDNEVVKKAVEGKDIVFHLAALVSIPYSYAAPRSNLEVNAIGTLNVLQACLEREVKKVVHTSSSAVYGAARQLPINERHSLQAQTPYSASKIAADKMAEAFYYSYGLPVATIRPFNAFGPRQSAMAVIPTIVSQCLTGKEICLGNLKPTRDFTYVSDLAKAFVKAGCCDKAVGETINIGTGKEISIGELAEKIIALVGKGNKIKTEKQKIRPEKSEILRNFADNTKAKSLLSWQPTVSLDEGLQKTIEWFKKNMHLYKPGLYSK